jgi:hypothetical protein
MPGIKKDSISESKSFMMIPNQIKNKWILFWLLTGIEGVIFGFSMFLLPSESSVLSIFGLSKYRFILFVIVLSLSGVCFFFSSLLYKQNPDLKLSDENKILRFSFWASVIAIMITISVFLIIQSPIGKIPLIRSIFDRFLPIFRWMGLYSMQMFILLFWRYKRMNTSRFYFPARKAMIITVAFLILSLSFLWIALKFGFGLNIISGTFYRQGVSLLEGQVILPVFSVFLSVLVGAGLQKRIIFAEKRRNQYAIIIEIMFPLCIWFIAALLWIRTPFEGRSYFLPALRQPNYNFYPSSDAENYDLLAQSILIGNGFRNGMTVVRPLYVAFLTLLHCIAQNDYMFLTNLQIIILALFPMMIYLIGKNIHHPLSGLLAAIWCIWREKESIRITPFVQVSNSRLLMSDLPMALIISFTVYAAIKWFQSDNRKLLFSLITGGCCGVGVLIRTQSAILIPAILLLSLFKKITSKQCSKSFFKETVLFVLGICFIILPWNIHSQVFPNTTVDHSSSEINYLYRLYEGSVNQTLRFDNDFENEIVKGSFINIILNYPKQILSSIFSHFVNNEVSTLLVMPARETNADSIKSWFHDPTLFWYRESSKGVLSENGILISVYCLIICLGLSFATVKSGLSGLMPLGIHIFYNIGTSFAMNSGFRFLLPVDWIGYFYFAIGIVGIFYLLLGLYFENLRDSLKPLMKIASDKRHEHFSKKTIVFLMVPFLLFGFILPFLDRFIPYRYDDATLQIQQLDLKERGISYLQQNLPNLPIAEMINEGKLKIIEGSAVYPRYYPANEGDSGASSSIKREAGYGRMVWMVINQRVNTISLPVYRSTAVYPIQDPMDVVVIGEQKKDYFHAWIIIGKAAEQTVIWKSSFLR